MNNKNNQFLKRYIGWEISRPKEIGIRHTGVVFGINEVGEILIIHNHPDTGVVIVGLKEFLDGQTDYRIRAPSLPLIAIRNNINKALRENRKYDLLTFNCQHFSSFIVDGYEESKDLQNWGSALLFFGLGYLATRR